jgi:enediyne biosynthesis protein E3
MPTTGIQEKIEKVISTFRSAQELAENLAHDELIEKLNSYDPEFRSVAFEAASMAIAASDFQQSEIVQASLWKDFYSVHKVLYEVQLLTGFGWALASHQKKPADFLNQFDSLSAIRILDGYGYYYGLLRSRMCIADMQIPEDIHNDLQFAFDQGLGRRMWYIGKGDLERLMAMLKKFPEERKANLWRGIGTASAFVGGIDLKMYDELGRLSGNHKKQLTIGKLFAIRSRMQAKSITESIKIGCGTLTGFNLETAYQFTEDAKQKSKNFKEWLSGMIAVM